jgi:hypothetical protein
MSDHALQARETKAGDSVISRGSGRAFCARFLEVATVTSEALKDCSGLILHARKHRPLAVEQNRRVSERIR